MKALRSVFDTNHNGRLDAGDARFPDFRVVVDGQVKTLAELGIVSIDLVADGAPRRYADGSSIEGRSSFTRADGSTGTAADASFVSDANGWRAEKTSVAGADGSHITSSLDDDGHVHRRCNGDASVCCDDRAQPCSGRIAHRGGGEARERVAHSRERERKATHDCLTAIWVRHHNLRAQTVAGRPRGYSAKTQTHRLHHSLSDLFRSALVRVSTRRLVKFGRNVHTFRLSSEIIDCSS
jgi:hypothetical protein